jgi:methionyl-tRNA synthetase
MSKFYITTAIPYVNAKPHIGHALEFVECDVLARYHRLKGEETALLTGADENALKNVQAAETAGIPIQEFVDLNADYFIQLAKAYNIQIDFFQKGSNQETHFPSSQKLWELCKAAGDIYQKEYEGLYCVGCETFYTADELNENGECFLHPGKQVQTVKETNYFFKLSKYQEQLITLISDGTYKIYPESRKNEVLGFLKEPLLDISISRSNERAKNWGVPVPGDDTQRMYVWFDALNIYQSGVGYGWDEALYKKWWPADVHVVGKDILRFHAVYWPAFLMSAQIPLPKQLFVHGFVTSEGQKMSKTLGNVIDPFTFLDEFGLDAVRYYLLREIPAGNDGDISRDRFKELYNADLANGLGNLAARIAALCVDIELDKASESDWNFAPEYIALLDNFEIDKALSWVWDHVRSLDKYINQHEPWKLKTDVEALKPVMQEAVTRLNNIAYHLQPFLPSTAEKLLTQFSATSIKKQDPYFARL